MRIAYCVKVTVKGFHSDSREYTVIHRPDYTIPYDDIRYKGSNEYNIIRHKADIVILDTLSQALNLIRELMPVYEKRFNSTESTFELNAHALCMI